MEELCSAVIKNFAKSGFRAKELENYFNAPKCKFATSFNMPSMPANAAPKAFGVNDQVKPSFWLCVCHGQITAPEVGYGRRCIKGESEAACCIGCRWPEKIGQLSSWRCSGSGATEGCVVARRVSACGISLV